MTGLAGVNLVGWLDLNSTARSLCGQSFILGFPGAQPMADRRGCSVVNYDWTIQVNGEGFQRQLHRSCQT